jgi:sulfite reductase alpha subunit-like flavoprotein
MAKSVHISPGNSLNRTLFLSTNYLLFCYYYFDYYSIISAIRRVLYDPKNPLYAQIHRWQELCSPEANREMGRRVLHVEIDIAKTTLRYQTGDHVAIYPSKDPLIIDLTAEALGITADRMDTRFEMKALDGRILRTCPLVF